jgi:UDP-N-acetylglucosamine--N-acetylmuramyl-(pentapeptide) pyrophosphoryl-undecaprenol N-acetylglucosamine transferase
VPRIPGLGHDLTWLTYPTDQSHSLLAGQPLIEAHLLESRDYRAVARNMWLATRVLHQGHFDRVITTGSGIALSVLPIARAHRIPCHYIESAARSAAPSTTGQLVRWIPGVRLYTQYPGWATGPWRYIGSVFDEFEAEPEPRRDVPLRRVVVTLGTSTRYGFRRLVDRLIELLPPEAEVLWQTGVTDVRDLGIAGRFTVPGDELDAAMREADVVVAHAGTGSALSALEAGRAPVLVPRRREYGENVDDHQKLVAAELERRGLAVDVRPETLTLADLATAAHRRIRPVPDPPPCRLVER